MTRMLSIIIPVFNEEGSLKTLIKNININIKKITENNLISDYEILFISDGSTDDSEKVIKEEINKDAHIKFSKSIGS